MAQNPEVECAQIQLQLMVVLIVEKMTLQQSGVSSSTVRVCDSHMQYIIKADADIHVVYDKISRTMRDWQLWGDATMRCHYQYTNLQ